MGNHAGAGQLGHLVVRGPLFGDSDLLPGRGLHVRLHVSHSTLGSSLRVLLVLVGLFAEAQYSENHPQTPPPRGSGEGRTRKTLGRIVVEGRGGGSSKVQETFSAARF